MNILYLKITLIGGLNRNSIVKEDMLILTCKLGNEIINCYDGTHNKEQLKKWASKKILLCPACGNPYEYCHGKVKTPYFRHMDKVECEDKFSESETEEHINGKRDLYEWVKKQVGVTNAVLEGWIPETKQRPDIMFEYKGKKYVIEYQCSPIATEYVERHELYQASGIVDIWIAGVEKYFKPNARHKFLEDYIEGYYNPATEVFRVGHKTEQGKFINYIHIKPSSFHLNGFVLENNSIIHHTYIGKNFDDLCELHDKRIEERNKDIEQKDINTEKTVKFLEKYVNKFNGTFGKYHYFSSRNNTVYCIYGDKYADFYKIDFDASKKKGIYKRIFDIKMNINILNKLNKLLINYENDNWNFYAYRDDNGIEIYIRLFDYFEVSFICNHDNFNINDENSIKHLLLPYMKQCLKKGLEGDRHMRIMEVIE